MTRSMVFTNTSNWDGEDYVLREQNGEAVCFDKQGKPCKEWRLKPGETVVVYPEGGEAYEFQPVEAEKVEPFYMNGRQMFPQADGSFK